MFYLFTGFCFWFESENKKYTLWENGKERGGGKRKEFHWGNFFILERVEWGGGRIIVLKNKLFTEIFFWFLIKINKQQKIRIARVCFCLLKVVNSNKKNKLYFNFLFFYFTSLRNENDSNIVEFLLIGNNFFFSFPFFFFFLFVWKPFVFQIYTN